MTHNVSTKGSADIIDWLERALNSEKGIAIVVGTKGQAIRQRQRIYTWRVADRKDNAKIYPPEHPMNGRSVYDVLTVDINDAGELLIRKSDASFYEVREL